MKPVAADLETDLQACACRSDKADKAEVRRLLNLLSTFMRMLGISNREAERRLGIKHSAVTRLFNGQIEAKLELVLGVARVIGLEYDEFFALAYPERRTADVQSESAQYLHMMIQELYPSAFRAAPARPASRPQAPAQEPMDPEELLRHIRKAIREVIGKLEAGEAVLEAGQRRVERLQAARSEEASDPAQALKIAST
jgi:plasmid maintenance system antidote protein VapI